MVLDHRWGNHRWRHWVNIGGRSALGLPCGEQVLVKEQVEGGSYASASEVIRDGLRLLEEDQQRRQAVIDGLRGEIERGRRSGKPKPAADVLDRLERKYTKMVKDRAK
jgi:antitoxin ParD1/3/4